MSSRLIGAVVIALALVVATVAGIAGGKKLAGQPVSVPMAAAPTVGSCLTQPVSQVGSGVSQDNKPVFPSVAIGACAGRHYGEVIAVVEHRFALPEAALTVFDSYEQWCTPALTDWLGGSAQPFNLDWALQYQETRQVAAVFTGPDERQQAAGQLWVACIAVPQVRVSPGGNTSAYEGSIRGGFARRPAPPGLSSCWEQPQDTYDVSASSDCSTGHRIEVVGHRYLSATVGTDAPGSPADQRSCRQFTSAVTGMADPTAGGRLTVDVQVAAPPDVATGASLDAWCVISPRAVTDYLFGPLLGLGSAPVPLG